MEKPKTHKSDKLDKSEKSDRLEKTNKGSDIDVRRQMEMYAKRLLLEDGFRYLRFKRLDYPGLARFPTAGDGSCFFHAICNAFYMPYRIREYSRASIAKRFRQELATKLSHKNGNGDIYYDILNNGELSKLAETFEELKLENMQGELDSDSFVLGYIYQQYVSDILKKDIYIIDESTEDLVLGSKEDFPHLYKKRQSIVLLYCKNSQHYEMVGLVTDTKKYIVNTHFDPEDPFILYLYNILAKKANL